VIKHPNRPNLPLNSIAIPDWRPGNYVHIDTDKPRHGRFPRNLGKEYPIMTQRGCPFSCSFCIESRYQELFGKKDSLRRRDIDVVMEELHWAKNNLDIETILFYDDVFTINPKWLKEFLPRYKEEIGLPFWCYTYPTTHDVELLKALKAAGCISITMGVQSGSERILKDYYNRPTKMSRVIEAGKEIVEAGLTGFFDLITINEFDREEDLRATFDFLTEFPKELKCLAFGQMISFPTYSYSVMSEQNQAALRDSNTIAIDDAQPSMEVYDYYHRLYRLTRTDLPKEIVKEIGADPKYRHNPALIDSYLNPEKIPRFTGLSA
jgi:anaerobic magnesium-protoporphyrin IX monomethyl ester cyclase